jgi:hypothetical protein
MTWGVGLQLAPYLHQGLAFAQWIVSLEFSTRRWALLDQGVLISWAFESESCAGRAKSGPCWWSLVNVWDRGGKRTVAIVIVSRHSASKFADFLTIATLGLSDFANNLTILIQLGIALLFWIRVEIHHRHYGIAKKTQRKSKRELWR